MRVANNIYSKYVFCPCNDECIQNTFATGQLIPVISINLKNRLISNKLDFIKRIVELNLSLMQIWILLYLSTNGICFATAFPMIKKNIFYVPHNEQNKNKIERIIVKTL